MTPCESHPDEAAKYFCLDCNARPVCSECVLTGAHSSHHALHAKKAYPIIRGKTDDLTQGMVTRIEELEIASKGLDAHINSLAHHADGIKAQIKTLMEEVVAKLVKKEKEFETIIDGMLDDNIKSVESFKFLIRDRVETLSNNISVIRENMEGDLHAALVFFADNISSLQAVVDEEPVPREKYENLIDKTESLMGSINITKFKDQLNSLSQYSNELGILPGRRTEQKSPGRVTKNMGLKTQGARQVVLQGKSPLYPSAKTTYG